MKHGFTLPAIVAILASAPELAGCSFLFRYTSFEPDSSIEFRNADARVSAIVINHRRSWLAFGPPLLPFVPFPAGQVPHLSYWSTLTVMVDVVNSQPSTLDLADSEIRVDGQRITPVEIKVGCESAIQRGALVLLEPRASRCLIYLDFDLAPDEFDHFDLFVGRVILVGEEHVLPRADFAKRSTLEYRAFALPLL